MCKRYCLLKIYEWEKFSRSFTAEEEIHWIFAAVIQNYQNKLSLLWFFITFTFPIHDDASNSLSNIIVYDLFYIFNKPCQIRYMIKYLN